MKRSIKYAVTVGILGYAVLALSALAVPLLIGLTTGYYPCVACISLALLVFRFTEIHWTFVLFPPLAAACAMVLLSKTPVNRRIAAGLGLIFPYLLAALVYVVSGAGEFPLEIAILWVAWAFVVGVASSIAVDKLRQSLRPL